MGQQTTFENAKGNHPIQNKVGGVFIHVRNMERSVNWYHKLFGMPDRSTTTEKVHAIAMDGGSDFVLDQNGYDSGLASGERALLMLNSSNVRAAYSFVKESGIEIVEDIMDFPGMAFFTFRDPDGNLLMICGDPGSEEEAAPVQVSKASIRYDAGGAVLSVSEHAALAKETAEGMELTGKAYTDTEYRVPVRLEAKVRLDKGSLFLSFGPHGTAALNFGNSPEVNEKGSGEDLFIVHPAMNKHFTFHGKGGVPVGQWARVSWTIQERFMDIHIDGQLFHRQEGYFGGASGHAGIAGVMGQITLKSFAVEELTADESPLFLPIGGSAGKEDRLIADPSCHAMSMAEGLWLGCDDRRGFARSGSVYEAPFVLKAEVSSSTRSAILYAGSTEMLRWNSEGKLCFIDPATKEEAWIDDASLPYGELARIEWRLEGGRTSLALDGRVVLDREGDYKACRFRLGIGAEPGSAVTIKSVSLN
ncbi:VOC family protein [Paenibacillus soyae]|uniref:VOC family protein n=1 Tax=Paenibacillus soyae TaxID=2969249 RepID=A0A9X2MY33_9BACL|nr:VOC family protein [Paenibacillus soyae]MCR2808008.1 VOC family protein [Paenibacillus soyae]